MSVAASVTSVMSKQHALNMIRLMYQSQGFVVSLRTSGEAIEHEFDVLVPEDNQNSFFFPFIDEIIHIYHTLSLAFIGSIAGGHAEHALNYHFARAAKELIVSIRYLSSRGLDLAARMQIRPFMELIQTWNLVNLDPVAKAEFLKSTDFLAANKFWHLYAKKARAEGIIEKKIAEVDKLSPFSHENLKAILPILGATIHPSYLALSLTGQMAFKNPGDGIVFNDFNNSTPFVLSNTIFISMMAFSPFQDFEFFVPDGLVVAHHPQHPGCATTSEFCKKLQAMPAALWFASIQFSNRLNPDPITTSGGFTL
jgi:hypothetical protein